MWHISLVPIQNENVTKLKLRSGESESPGKSSDITSHYKCSCHRQKLPKKLVPTLHAPQPLQHLTADLRSTLQMTKNIPQSFLRCCYWQNKDFPGKESVLHTRNYIKRTCRKLLCLKESSSSAVNNVPPSTDVVPLEMLIKSAIRLNNYKRGISFVLIYSF